MSKSNEAARATWERKAVGSQRAKAEAGSPEYFTQIREYRYGYETPFIPETFRFSDMEEKRVLEIGVGNGIDAVEMMRNGAVYTGLDITRNHLELTRQNMAVSGVSGIRVEGDLLATELPGSFDVVYSFGALHHIAHEAEYLRKIRSLLAPGGELRIAVYSKWSFFNIYMVAMWFANGRKQPLDDYRSQIAEHSEPGNPVTIKIRSRREVQRELEAAGFQVIRYEKRGFVQNYLPVIGKRLAPDGPVLRAFGRLLGWYHCFTCKSLSER
jgi:SAM-dependent methyltransferase